MMEIWKFLKRLNEKKVQNRKIKKSVQGEETDGSNGIKRIKKMVNFVKKNQMLYMEPTHGNVSTPPEILLEDCWKLLYSYLV